MKKLVFAFSIGVAILWSCEPKPSMGDLVKRMVVVTDYNDTVNFSKRATYYLALDTIKYFNPSSQYYPSDTLQVSCQTNCNSINKQLYIYPTSVNNEIQKQLNLAGFTQVPSIKNADMWVYVFIVENLSVSQSYSYYPYGYYGYGYGYGSYYPTVSVSDQADLRIDIFDLKNNYQGYSNRIRYAQITDLVTTPEIYSQSTIAIDQAFKQSSYLKK